MKIERIELDNNRSYELGQAIKFWPANCKLENASSKIICLIELEPTGQVCLTLEGGEVILIGNTPYKLYCSKSSE